MGSKVIDKLCLFSSYCLLFYLKLIKMSLMLFYFVFIFSLQLKARLLLHNSSTAPHSWTPWSKWFQVSSRGFSCWPKSDISLVSAVFSQRIRMSSPTVFLFFTGLCVFIQVMLRRLRAVWTTVWNSVPLMQTPTYWWHRSICCRGTSRCVPSLLNSASVINLR